MLQNRHPADIAAAAPDALAIALRRSPRNPHPLAAEIADSPLSKLAYAIGAKLPGPHNNPDRPVSAAMTAGLRTTDFASQLAAALGEVLITRFERSTPHRAFAPALELPNFKPQQLAGGVALNPELPTVGDGGEIQTFEVSTRAGAVAKLHCHAAMLVVSREMVINDDVGAIAGLLEQAAAAAARTEAQAVYGVLESDTPLADPSLTVPRHTSDRFPATARVSRR